MSIEQESTMTGNGLRIHYAWVIVFTGIMVLFSGLGLGRFSLGMLLPSMGETLRLDYTQMGLIGTANVAGIMIGVTFVGKAVKRFGARRTISFALVLVAVTMMSISRVSGFIETVVLYTATGIGIGASMIPTMALPSQWFAGRSKGRATGIITSGCGFAMVFTGMFLPWANSSMGPEGWRTCWQVMGVIALIVAGTSAYFLRNHPDEKGLFPLGTTREASSQSLNEPRSVENEKQTLLHLSSIFFLFGAAFAVCVTFLVADMVYERGIGEGIAGNFWAMVGTLSIFSGSIFGSLSDKFGRKLGMAVAFGGYFISYALMATDLPNFYLYLSIGIFGLSMWSIQTIMSATVGDYVGPENAVSVFGFITIFYTAGQMVGPVIAGYIADATDSFSMGYVLCAIMSGIAVIATLALKKPSNFQKV